MPFVQVGKLSGLLGTQCMTHFHYAGVIGACNMTSSWRLPGLALSETGLILAEIRDISRSVVPPGRDSHNNMIDHFRPVSALSWTRSLNW